MALIPERRTVKTIPSFEDLNIVVFGIQKVGKTSFFSGEVDSVTIAAEPGSDFLAARPVEVTRYSQFIDVLEEVKKAPSEYSGIIIDTVDYLYQMCQDHVCRQLRITDPSQASYGKGWNEIKKTWEGWLNYGHSFTRYRFISHMEEKEIDQINDQGLAEKYITRVQRFNGNKARWLDGSCNLVGYMSILKGGHRCITFANTPQVAAGDRTTILEGLGTIKLPDKREDGFGYVSELYRERAEKLGYQLTYRRKKQ